MKSLIFFLGHLDDFEISCLGYLMKHHQQYDEIRCVIASYWEPKAAIWRNNLADIHRSINREIKYENLGFEQRSLTSNFDKLKDKFYKSIDFDSSHRFDIVTHDAGDCHTDHTSVCAISRGLYKYTNRFVAVHSPSSIEFKPNYWIGLNKLQFALKKKMIDRYNIGTEQSYSKSGYYLQSDCHYNIGNAYYMENFVHTDEPHCECYRILKWS